MVPGVSVVVLLFIMIDPNLLISLCQQQYFIFVIYRDSGYATKHTGFGISGSDGWCDATLTRAVCVNSVSKPGASSTDNNMRRPGIEPGLGAWKAPVIAIRPSALSTIS